MIEHFQGYTDDVIPVVSATPCSRTRVTSRLSITTAPLRKPAVPLFPSTLTSNIRLSEFPMLNALCRPPMELVACKNPRSLISDAVKNIEASIFLSALDEGIASLAVVSATPGEGKSFLAVSLASVLAGVSKKRVVLVDADMRRPRIHRIFSLPPDAPGLRDFLGTSKLYVGKVINRTAVRGLFVISSGTKTADPVALEVVSNLGEKPEEAQLKPIYGIIPTASSWSRYLVYAAIGLAVFVAAFARFWWFRRRRMGKGSIIFKDPPHVLAQKNLESLEAKGLFESGCVKEYYFRFSEILRQYLEALRGFPAAEYTTPEIALHINQEPDQRLLPLLRESDLVKFADVVPTRARKEEELDAALSYIRDTGAEFGSDLSFDKQRLKGSLGQEEGTP